MTPLHQSRTSPFKISLHWPQPLSRHQLMRLCELNPDLLIEQTSEGDLILMSPTASDMGGRNASLTGQLWAWNARTRLGQTFDSSGGFELPNGSTRAPDAAWVRSDRWLSLTQADRESFAPLCPDFVVELRSQSDTVADLKRKLQEYIDNGARLGWLIDPKQRRVWIFRPDQEIEELESPSSLAGETVLPGFVLDLAEIFAD